MRSRLLLATFTATIFTSASLLFVVQPMVGKMILPHLGGSSSVWTTCMLFFQTMLVAGYLYAHVIAQKMAPRWQIGIHCALILAALVFSLPFEITGAWIRTDSMPAVWLLVALLASVGLPLFVVSSSAPLLQHWFSFTDHPDAEDPYYLYAASNVGSMLALFGYPFLVERLLAVDTQAWSWAVGFGGLAVLTGSCGALLWGRDLEQPTPAEEADEPSPDDEELYAPLDVDTSDRTRPVTWKRRGWWLLVTFIPSSLMLGVTDYLTTDIASVPLLWVVPLGLYLLSFILAFARLPLYLNVLRAALPAVALLVLAATFANLVAISTAVILHLVLFFALTLYFHGRLAEDRPTPQHLTEFYIWMSVGGALGGVFNALLAPMIFDWMIDYYLILAVAVAVIAPLRTDAEFRTRWTAAGAGLTTAAALGLFVWSVGLISPDRIGSLVGTASVLGVIVGMALWEPMVQNVILGVLLLIGCSFHADFAYEAHYERSFFAGYTVYKDRREGTPIRVFSHGTTLHGLQAREGPLEHEPIGYYHPRGPLGDIFETLPHERVAVAGLGTGGMAAYAEEGTHMTFYEIDPVVEKIARERFTFLEHCGERCSVKIGDARKLLEEAEPDSFDLLFMDAYNSDSVPTHLLTVEAMKLYLSRLDDDGVAIFHVSNRFIDVEGIVGRLADHLDLVTRTRHYSPVGLTAPPLAYGSVYTVVARKKEHLHGLAADDDWEPTSKADVLWTDQFTNIVSVLEW